MTIAPTESSTSASPRAWLSSTIRAAFKAFRALGRLSVIKATDGSGRVAVILEYDEIVESVLAARGSRRRAGVALKTNRNREYISIGCPALRKECSACPTTTPSWLGSP
jgi:hypothetical protein